MSTTPTATGSSSPRSFPAAELERALGAAPVHHEPVVGGGYGTNTARWRVGLADGRAAFAKLALDEVAAGWLRDEHRVYSRVQGSFMPRLLGWHDDERTLLVLEDLGDAYWPPPWTAQQIEDVLAALDAMHATPAPPGLPPLEEERLRLDGWTDVAADPEPFLATGLASRAWLAIALPTLRAASAACDLHGNALVHLDVRSDNLCFRGREVLFVDWNLAHVGEPLLDVVAWLPSLRLEGGPEPWELVGDSRGLAALVAGFFASRAGLPPPATAPRVREFQRRQGQVALAWAARELALAPPDR